MTLDEAIQHAREVAQSGCSECEDCLCVQDWASAEARSECCKEHEQLADWLEELRDLRQAQGRKYIDRLELKSLAWESGSPAVPDFLHGIGELREPETVQLVDREEALAVAQRIDKYAWSDFTDLVESLPVWVAVG